MKKYFLITVPLFLSAALFAQKTAPINWQLKDPKADKIYGAGVEEAYKTLKGKTPKTVIVAVIDAGVDVNHEDLKDVIWTNPGEIADNGIDDDKNGYIDDVHGWSFIGGKNGDINYESLELARLYQSMTKKFKAQDTLHLSVEDSKQFEEYKKIRTEFLADQGDNKQQLFGITLACGLLEKIKKQNNGVLSKSTFKSYKAENDIEKQLKKSLKLAFIFLKPKELEDQLTEAREQLTNTVKFNEMNADSVRQYMVGDDVNNPNEHYYGNNHIQGPDALHGTHVAGIIAAMRNNNIGINGMANNVKIMVVRAVPNGDERDKDIANGIRYAVDNGASIINMSFGKYYSPDKKVVDDAVEYALSKDVLLIHAAGNESKNKDVEESYPSRELLSKTIAPNWIEVGANSYKAKKNIFKSAKLIASFSNYGTKRVDLFAPGVDIYSTIPDNKYISESGTSMACPSTAGVAAIIRGYFPELKANEVRELLMKTVVPYSKPVNLPGGGKKDKKQMSELCISGGFINANNAVREVMGLNTKKNK